MILKFELRREDVLALWREYYSSSPAMHRGLRVARYRLPSFLLLLWLGGLLMGRVGWFLTVYCLGCSLVWFLFQPLWTRRRVERSFRKSFDEMKCSETLGGCELVLSDDGILSSSPMGSSNCSWSVVSKVSLTEDYLFIFLSGGQGHPVAITQIGADTAQAAFDYINARLLLAANGKTEDSPAFISTVRADSPGNPGTGTGGRL